MSRLSTATPDRLFDFRRVTSCGLGLWIAVGLLALVLIPAARGSSEWIGWLPYWLVLAPALSLAVLQREHLAPALSITLRSGAVARRRQRRGQARRSRREPAQSSPWRTGLAALLLR